jgi:hypothetical protein
MEVLPILGVIVLAIGVSAGTLLVFPAMLRGFRAQWERFPRDARRRGFAAGALTALCMIVAAILVIVAPWGPISVLYVIALLGAAEILLMLAVVAGDSLRVRRRR